MSAEFDKDFAPRGDNKPPVEFELPSTDEIVASLEVNYGAIVERTDEIVAKAERFYLIQTDEEEAEATEFMNIVRANFKTGEAERVREKDAYDQRAGTVHAWFKTNILDRVGLGPAKPTERFDPVTRTELGVGPRINQALTIYKTAKLEEERKRRAEEQRIAWEAAEKARKAREAADAAALEAQRAANRKRSEESKAAAEAAAAAAKRAAETAALAEAKAAEERAAADQAANAKAADLTRARGGRGGISSLREFLNHRDVNRETLDLNALRPYLDDKSIEKALNAYAKANGGTIRAELKAGTQPVKGVTFFIDHSTSGRA